MNKIFEEEGWIWYDHYGFDDVNTYMLARKMFNLEKIPPRAEIKITADTRYKLYVNGKYVCFGPARGYPENYPFDRVDIAEYLKQGKNIIAVVVHQYGHGTFQSIYAGAAGFIVSGKIGKVNIGTKKDNEWFIKKCPAHKQDMVRRSVQLGYQENFDARKIESDWMLPKGKIEEKNGWRKVEKAGHLWRISGSAPWFNFEERGIPLLKEEVKHFKKIKFVYYGNVWKKWESERNLTVVYLNEMNGKEDKKRVNSPENMLKDGSSFTKILPFPKNKKISFIIDYGEEVAGFIGFEIEGNGGEVLDFTVSELLENNWLCVTDPSEGCKVAMSDRYIARRGRQSYEFFSIQGFRYLCLTVRNVEKKSFKIKKVYVRQVSYPFEKQTIFKTSDEKINKIWEMCVRTQINCSFDAYVDCPWREQAQWWGDARVQAANTYYAFGDMRLFRRGIKQAGQSQLPNGLTYGHFPTIAVGCILPDFTLTWIHTHLDYYRYTGDKSLMEEQFKKMEKAMEFFSDYIEKNYLLGPMPEWWVFLDWAPLYKEGWNCFFNLLYLSSLKTMIKICEILRKSDKKKYYTKLAGILQKRIMKIFWDEKEKVFWDGYNTKSGKIVKNLSQHTHSFAILLDLKRQYHKKWVEDILLPPMKLQPFSHKKIIEGSTFFYYYIIEAMKKVGGYEKEIIDFIKARWGKMLEEGATTCYEIWNPNPGNTSLCHAWSAHPIVHFVELIAGIKPISPNWEKIKVNPNPLNLEKLEVSIPVSQGKIELEVIGRRKVELNIPKKVTVA